jgi:spore maturation protein CgeB
MASKTLVCSSLPFDNLENYFVPDSNFVLINENDFVDKIIYYLEHEDERKKIVENAYEIIIKYHTSEIRAKQLVDIIVEGLT